jgi:hypothetical protein
MKIKGSRHGSRSSAKGRILTRCSCGGDFTIVMSDHYNLVATCNRGCGNIKEEHRTPNGVSLFDIDKGKR